MPKLAAGAPTVSVIVPVYNELPHLEQTIRSALDQDLREIEVIAVNDGSTDGSGAELDRLAAGDARLIVIHQPGSGWPGAPRNRGLERASGRYVFFLDGDDRLAATALGEMVGAMEHLDTDTPAADVVIPKMRGTGGRKIPSLFLRYSPGTIALKRAMETLTPQKMIRRELIEREGLRFHEGEVRLEDGIFMAEAYIGARRIAYCGKRPLYFFSKQQGANTSSRNFKPSSYVESCRLIVDTLRTGVADDLEAERLITAVFVKLGLRFYTPERWRRTHPLRRRAWLRLHRDFLTELVPVSAENRVAHPTDRSKIALIRQGKLGRLNALISAERRLAHSAALVSAETWGTGGLRLTVDVSSQGARSLQSRADGAALLLAGYREGEELRVPCDSFEPETARAVFTVPDSVLERLQDDRVAFWTVLTMPEGFSSARVRLRASAAAKITASNVRTLQGSNVALDLRR